MTIRHTSTGNWFVKLAPGIGGPKKVGLRLWKNTGLLARQSLESSALLFDVPLNAMVIRFLTLSRFYHLVFSML